MNGMHKYHCRGIALTEILVVVGFFGILVSFASVSASNAVTRKDMLAAGENLQYSIQMARNYARMTESIVSMNLLDNPAGAGQRITFSATNLAGKNLAHINIQGYQNDGQIKFVSDFPSYEFNSRGIVRNPGRITLALGTDDSVISQIMVE